MRKACKLFFLLLLFISNCIQAQAPQKMSYQIVVRDSVGALITNANVGFKISILKDSAAGSVVYAEIQNINTNNNGLASLEIGGGSPITGSFSTIMWGSSSYFIKTEIDPLGGVNYSMSGVSQLLSVPYALYAENTKKGTLPTVTTNSAIAPINSNTTATVTCNLVNNGGEFVLAKGVCYSTSTNPSLNNAYETFPVGSSSATSNGNYTIQLNNLTSNTNYYLKAFATTINGTAYGNEIIAKTNAFIAPTLNNLSLGAVTRTSAIVSAEVITDGGAAVTQRGFCYSSTNGNPTIADSKLVVGSGVGNFTGTINSLIAGTAYSLRAFATNNIGTTYGNQVVQFTTMPLVKPAIITLDTSNVTASTVNLGGKIVDNGGTTIIEKGICYSKSPNPTIANYKVIAVGADSFRANLDTLLHNTIYYARAYAINSVGLSYGNEISFKTDSLRLGAKYQGGIIFYMLQPGDSNYDVSVPHGLIAAVVPYDIGTNWGPCYDSVFVGADGVKIGTGKQNTQAIVASAITCSPPASIYVAKMCSDYVVGIYDDWYLPSKDELNVLYQNRTLVGGFETNSSYWSSSQSGINSPLYLQTAWAQNFNNGSQSGWDGTYVINYFRAIRSF